MFILHFDRDKITLSELKEVYNSVLELLPDDVIAIPQEYQLINCSLKELEQIKSCIDFAIEREKEKNEQIL